MVSIQVTPRRALVDVPFRVLVIGLKSGQYVTLRSKLISERNIAYFCIAHYAANSDGKINLDEDPSSGGYYRGIEPMALIWAMRISPTCEKKYTRLEKTDVETPFLVEIAVFESHISDVELTFAIDALASTEIERLYMGDNVQRIPIATEQIEGTLFLPKRGEPLPGVIDLFGGKSGITEFRAALLASRGYATLALKYLDMNTSMLEGLQMEYFENAVKYLKSRREVKNCGIGVVGVSLGGTIALFMAAYIPGIRCVVNINGPIWANAVYLFYKGKTWKPIPWNTHELQILNNAWYMRDIYPNLSAKQLGSSKIEFYHSKVPIMFIASGDDACFRWEEHRELAEELMKIEGKTNYEFIENPGAGHLLEPPFSPFFWATYFYAGVPYVWGGNAKAHARAQEISWREMLRFLRVNFADVAELTSKL